VVERHLRVHALEPGVLGFQLLDPLQVRRLHAAVLGLPLVVRGRTDAGLPADVLDRDAGVGLLEDRDDLGLGETGLLHGTSWLQNVPESSTSVVSTYWGSLRWLLSCSRTRCKACSPCWRGDFTGTSAICSQRAASTSPAASARSVLL